MSPDTLLNAEELAQVLGQPKRWILRHAAGRKPLIPAVRLGHRTVLFHLLTVRLALARASGLKVTAADLVIPHTPAASPLLEPAASPAITGSAAGDPLSAEGGRP